MLPISGDRTFLDYVIANFAHHGAREVLLLAGHLAEVVRRRYDGAEIGGAGVRVFAEPAPAGTAGALRYAADALDDTFLMSNGDAIIDMNHHELEQALSPADSGVLALRRMPDGSRYGRVEMDGRRIVAFHEKDVAFRGEALISAGLYALRRNVLDLIATTPCSIETDVFPRLAASGLLCGVESSAYFIDIGLPETLEEARTTVPAHFGRQCSPNEAA